MSLQSDSGYLYGRHQRPKEASRPPYSAELASQRVLEIRAQIIHHMLTRERNPIIRLTDIEDCFTQTARDVCQVMYEQNLAPNQVSVDFLHLLAWTQLTKSSTFETQWDAEVASAQRGGTANERGRHPAPEYEEYYHSQKAADDIEHIRRHVKEKQHQRESQSSKHKAHPTHFSSWDTQGQAAAYSYDKIVPYGGGESSSSQGPYRPSYTMTESPTQAASHESFHNAWDMSSHTPAQSPTQTARDEPVWGMSSYTMAQSPTQTAIGEPGWGMPSRTTASPSTETLKHSQFSPSGLNEPSIFGLADTQVWVDVQHRRSPSPLPSPRVQSGPQKPELEVQWGKLMRQKFDDEDEETGDWADTEPLSKKLDSVSIHSPVKEPVHPGLDSMSDKTHVEIIPPPVVKKDSIKKDKGKDKLIAATPDLSKLPAKAPAKTETAASGKLPAKAPAKTETAASEKLTAKAPATQVLAAKTQTAAPGKAQDTQVVPSGRKEVQAVGRTSSAVKRCDDVVYLPGEPPSPPPSAPPKADDWQVAQGKRKDITTPNLGIVPPDQLRQSSVATPKPMPFYGKEAVFISPVPDRQKVINGQMGKADLQPSKDGVPVEPLQLFIPAPRWVAHCKASNVRNRMVELLDPRLSLSYVQTNQTVDNKKVSGFFLNINLRNKNTKRSESLEYAWVQTYIHLLLWKNHYHDLDMATGFETARRENHHHDLDMATGSETARRDSTYNQVELVKSTASASSGAVAGSQAQGRATPVEQKQGTVAKESQQELSKFDATEVEAQKIKIDVQSRIGQRSPKEAKDAMVRFFKDIRSSLYDRGQLALIIFYAWKDIDPAKHYEVAKQWYYDALKNRTA